MKHLFVAIALLMTAALPAPAAEATFERNLSVNGRVELTVNTGSGYIHLTKGSDNQVHIYGKVHSNNWSDDNEQRVREIAANPPIEQTGNIVRIGAHHENLHNVSIDYEVQAPANAFLRPVPVPATLKMKASAIMPSYPPAPAAFTPPDSRAASPSTRAPAASMPSKPVPAM